MVKKINLVSFLRRVFKGEGLTKKEKTEAEKFIKNSLEDDYGKYLEKPPKYHDSVIKRMYKDTRHAAEKPERLREILREQVTGHKKSS